MRTGWQAGEIALWVLPYGTWGVWGAWMAADRGLGVIHVLDCVPHNALCYILHFWVCARPISWLVDSQPCCLALIQTYSHTEGWIRGVSMRGHLALGSAGRLCSAVQSQAWLTWQADEPQPLTTCLPGP